MAHHQVVHSSIKQSLDLIIISSMWIYVSFFGVWFMETDMCTVIGTVCMFQYVHCTAPIIVHMSVCVRHTLMNFSQAHRLETIIRSKDCFIELCTPWWWAILLLIKRYNLYKVLACSNTFFQLSLSCAAFFQLLTFMLFVSSKTSSSQHVLGLPTCLLDMGFRLLMMMGHWGQKYAGVCVR